MTAADVTLVAGEPDGVVSAAGGGRELEVLRQGGERQFEFFRLHVIGKMRELALRTRQLGVEARAERQRHGFAHVGTRLDPLGVREAHHFQSRVVAQVAVEGVAHLPQVVRADHHAAAALRRLVL